ncbi:MAG: hypothetical protein Q8936_22795 [Bacillota bacterium]|nr:hypothetical protein [Bacillota bacterium]
MNKYSIKRLIPYILIIVLLLSSYFVYKITTKEQPPSSVPIVEIKLKGKNIPTNLGEFNWGGPDGTRDAGSPYDVGNRTQIIMANPGETIDINIDSIPKEIQIFKWTGYAQSCNYEKFINTKSCKVTLPKQSGEYIFEVEGYWDKDNWTSNIFHVQIK